ncbi:uncharacterized protein [Dermacentor albipictus]|uniref:uncharacterized protein n=1 Tax=Dermacentor albipictus TaxID=60249 RepID=UPI0038FC6EFE
MPDDARTPPAPPTAPATLVCAGALRQRDPPIFSGTDDKDVEDWISSYERVSAHNQWDDVTKLRNVAFYLTDVAKLWFLNHEADLTSWLVFKTNFTQVFGRPAVRKLRAEQRLRTRSQETGENFTSYIEDIVDLCKRVNASMSEEEKIKHIMKGIQDDAFQMLLSKSPHSVAEVIELCQSYDELRRQRLHTRRPTPPADSLSSLGVDDYNHATLFIKIQEFVRAEVARQLSLISSVQEPPPALHPTIRDFIQEQVSQAVPPAVEQPPVTAPLTYAEAVSRSRPQAPLPPSMHRPPTFLPPSMPLHDRRHFPPMPLPDRQPFPNAQPRLGPYPHQWRTFDDRPICFACGGAGHVARHCRRGMPPLQNIRRAPPFPAPFSSSPSSLPTSSFSPDRPTASTRRSPSPRRRSLSPMRRRPVSTEQEN